jgi:hypothetical protein
MMYETRNYTIFSVSELGSIDFTQVLETSAETVRKSVDESKTFVKWDGDIPSSVQNLTTKDRLYTHDEILEVLSTEEWNSPNMDMM